VTPASDDRKASAGVIATSSRHEAMLPMGGEHPHGAAYSYCPPLVAPPHGVVPWCVAAPQHMGHMSVAPQPVVHLPPGQYYSSVTGHPYSAAAAATATAAGDVSTDNSGVAPAVSPASSSATTSGHAAPRCFDADRDNVSATDEVAPKVEREHGTSRDDSREASTSSSILASASLPKNIETGNINLGPNVEVGSAAKAHKADTKITAASVSEDDAESAASGALKDDATSTATSSPEISEGSAVNMPEVNKAKKDKESTLTYYTNVNCQKWHDMAEELRTYRSIHGTCAVPRGDDNYRLAIWVSEQRKQFTRRERGKPSFLTDKRVATLKDMGFIWNAQEAKWEGHYEDLKCFHRKYGHALVPQHCKEFPQLGQWVREQRKHYAGMLQGDKVAEKKMTPTRLAALQELGFVFDCNKETWWERYRELEEFKREKGHCIVPKKYRENPQLGMWVGFQRTMYNKRMKTGNQNAMSSERIEALEKLGFVWSPREERRLS